MKVLYITYVDFGDFTSGSNVRPQRMYEAFVELGHEVKLLECQQNRRKQRKERVNKITQWLKTTTPDICYIESPSGPIFNVADLHLIRRIHKMGIPIGYYCRDYYWKFNMLGEGKKNAIAWLKSAIIKCMCKRDWNMYIYPYSDIVYFVSGISIDQFGRKSKMRALPPGCVCIGAEKTLRTTHTPPIAIYVGGVSERYGTNMLIDAFNIINKERICVKLKLVCREAEWDHYIKTHDVNFCCDWIEVMHVSGEALDAQYDESDMALIPLANIPYHKGAVPIKLMEYISKGIPIVATNCDEAERIIMGNNIGIATEYNAVAFAKGLLQMAESPERQRTFSQNAARAAVANSWTNRAKQVVNEVSGMRK